MKKLSRLMVAVLLGGAAMLLDSQALKAAFIQDNGIPNFVRVGPVGDSWGPPSDFLQAEVVFGLAGKSSVFGIQLQNDANAAAHQAMFELVRDAFLNNLRVTVDFENANHALNFTATRVMLSR